MWGGIAGIQILRDEETLIAITGYAGAADVNMTWLPAYDAASCVRRLTGLRAKLARLPIVKLEAI